MINWLIRIFSKEVKRPILRDDYDFNEMKVNREREMNRILEKISKKGQKSLSEKEKDFLDKYY